MIEGLSSQLGLELGLVADLGRGREMVCPHRSNEERAVKADDSLRSAGGACWGSRKRGRLADVREKFASEVASQHCSGRP
jgi:hypothetical protein